MAGMIDIHAYRDAIDPDCVIGVCSINNCLYPDCVTKRSEPMPQATTYNQSVDAGPSMPDRIRRLPISDKGFPVPWFVAWFTAEGAPCGDGRGFPDFRVIDPRKIRKAMDANVCWTCGQPGGAHKAFILGPMCCINKIISEPPSHRDCAIWSARNCPFLSKPRMVRNLKGIPAGMDNAAGVPLDRNPGAVCVWVTRSYRPFRPPGGGILFSVGHPVETLWFANGRRATRAEIMQSIWSGYPTLEAMAREDGPEAMKALVIQRDNAIALVPDA